MIHVYDLDGTLADSTHRFRVGKNGKIDLQFWIEHDTPEYIAKDRVLPLATQYKRDLENPDIYVVIATARVIKPADLQWIKDNLGLPDKIVSRKDREDKRKGADLKIKGCAFLKNLRQFRHRVIHFWEDNPEYLYPFCEALNAIPHYVESSQGV